MDAVEIVAVEARIGCTILMRTSRVLVVVVDRALTHVARERGGQTGTRIDIAKDHIGHGTTCLVAQRPCIKYGIGQRFGLGERQRSAGGQDENYRLAGSLQRFEKFYLREPQGNVGT